MISQIRFPRNQFFDMEKILFSPDTSQHVDTKLNELFPLIDIIWIGGSRGYQVRLVRPPPPGAISFIFMRFSGKIWSNHLTNDMLVPALEEVKQPPPPPPPAPLGNLYPLLVGLRILCPDRIMRWGRQPQSIKMKKILSGPQESCQ